jgi:hypothetical protein
MRVFSPDVGSKDTLKHRNQHCGPALRLERCSPAYGVVRGEQLPGPRRVSSFCVAGFTGGRETAA